jgi:hypothetical protein
MRVEFRSSLMNTRDPVLQEFEMFLWWLVTEERGPLREGGSLPECDFSRVRRAFAETNLELWELRTIFFFRVPVVRGQSRGSTPVVQWEDAEVLLRPELSSQSSTGTRRRRRGGSGESLRAREVRESWVSFVHGLFTELGSGFMPSLGSTGGRVEVGGVHGGGGGRATGRGGVREREMEGRQSLQGGRQAEEVAPMAEPVPSGDGPAISPGEAREERREEAGTGERGEREEGDLQPIATEGAMGRMDGGGGREDERTEGGGSEREAEPGVGVVPEGQGFVESSPPLDVEDILVDPLEDEREVRATEADGGGAGLAVAVGEVVEERGEEAGTGETEEGEDQEIQLPERETRREGEGSEREDEPVFGVELSEDEVEAMGARRCLAFNMSRAQPGPGRFPVDDCDLEEAWKCLEPGKSVDDTVSFQRDHGNDGRCKHGVLQLSTCVVCYLKC